MKQTNYTTPYIYFDIDKYPVEGNPFESDAWIILKNHTQASALKYGYSLYINGGAWKYKFRCYKGKQYKDQSKLTQSYRTYRKTSMINNRSRGRGRAGLKLKRRRGHHRPTKHTCKFTFTVCDDEIGYHIMKGRGNSLNMTTKFFFRKALKNV